MNRIVNLIPSGFRLIDVKWGGIYKGGSYLIVGQRKSGRTLLALQLAMETAKSKETCLYFTNMRPKDLIIQAASINFDIQHYMNNNTVIVVRVAPPTDSDLDSNPDEVLSDYIRDIVQVVNDYRPQSPKRVIFDELTPYLGFSNLDALQSVFLQTLEKIEDMNISSFFVISEPAAKRAETIVDVIASNVTGIIHLRKNQTKVNQYYGGKVVITPNVGHTEGQFIEDYTIQPLKGIFVDLPEPEIVKEYIEEPKSIPNYFESKIEQYEEKSIPTVEPKNMEITLEKINELQKQKRDNENSNKTYKIPNYYNVDDFSLILNNQIALYKSTGQLFTLVTFKLDPTAHLRNLLNINQLQEAIGSVVDKKDKMCLNDGKVIVLLVRSNNEKIHLILNNLKNHLPSSDKGYIDAIMDLIHIHYLPVNEEFENADSVMNRIKSDDQNKNNFYALKNLIK